jgi:hypothetical protein
MRGDYGNVSKETPRSLQRRYRRISYGKDMAGSAVASYHPGGASTGTDASRREENADQRMLFDIFTIH